MITALLLAMQAAPAPQSAPLPKPLTEIHQRDLGCVATMAILADEQRRGVAPAMAYPNVMERGRKWAGLVGNRVVAETNQPKEVIGVAIQQAAQAQQKQRASLNAGARLAQRKKLTNACLPLLDKEVPAQKPVAEDYLFCAAIISLTAEEIEGREGAGSVNAKAMRSLAEQLARKYQAAFVDYPPLRNTTKEWVQSDIRSEMDKQRRLVKEGGGVEALSEAEGEAKYQRCIFLGE